MGLCLSFLSSHRVICILLVSMKCVNFSILFLIPSMLSCSMFVVCSGVCSIIWRGVQGWFRGGGGGSAGVVV